MLFDLLSSGPAITSVWLRWTLPTANVWVPDVQHIKSLAAAAVLKRVDEKQDQLERFIRYEAKDILEHAPVTKAHLNDGGMTLGAKTRLAQ